MTSADLDKASETDTVDVNGIMAVPRTETANERQHRSNRTVQGFSSKTAAKLIILDNIADGSRLLEMPKSTMFLVMRKTAAESIVIGWLLRHTLTAEWRDAVKSLDYATLMKGGN